MASLHTPLFPVDPEEVETMRKGTGEGDCFWRFSWFGTLGLMALRYYLVRFAIVLVDGQKAS